MVLHLRVGLAARSVFDPFVHSIAVQSWLQVTETQAMRTRSFASSSKTGMCGCLELCACVCAKHDTGFLELCDSRRMLSVALCRYRIAHLLSCCLASERCLTIGDFTKTMQGRMDQDCAVR